MKRLLSFVLVMVMLFSAFPVFTVNVSAATSVNDASVFLKQPKGSSTCTLVSAAMMLRRRALLEGNGNWNSITESSLKPTAWAPGLYNSFKYAGMSVTSGKFSGSAANKKSQLQSLLNSHPEGVVIYMYGDGLKCHAVLATDFTGGTLYCADPANGYPSGRIPITSACLTGATQDARIGNLKKYWYVNSGNCNITVPEPAPAPPTHTHSYSTYYESIHPHKYYKKCSCGDFEYTGKNNLQTSCSKCYPVGNVVLTRTFEKTKGTAVLKRNNVENANSYTLKVYKDGNTYGTYNMNSTSYSLSGLNPGRYSAELTAKNTNTGESRYGSCTSFTILNTYNVSYNANGGSNAPSAQTKIQDSDLTISSGIPVKEGHIFKGWASSKNAIEAQYQPGGKYTKNAKITLWAVWEPETYTIKFDANGGKGELNDTTITYGDTLKMPNSVIQDYFYLKGWSTKKDATNVEYKLGMDYMIKANTTLYAVWGQSTWSGDVSNSLKGKGTEEEPYEIATAADLAYVANKVNSQTSAPNYEYYKLTDNINLCYNEWVPIGLFANENQYFCGSFDGNGYTISDLYITKENGGNIGLFGFVKDSEIKNITVTGAIESISSASALNIGGITGKAENTKLENLSSMYFNMGSIEVGTSDFSHMGTITGYVDGGSVNNCKSNECHIDLKSGMFETGMIAGYCNADVTDCSVKVSEEGLFSTAATVGKFKMGGLCGTLMKNAEKCTVEAPYLSNNIKTTAESMVGGLTGYMDGEAKICTVKFTDADANSITASGTGTSKIGGITGYASKNSKITDSKYDGGSISATSTSGGASVGGFIGQAVAKSNPTVSVNGGQSLSRDELPKKDGYKAIWYTDPDFKTEYDFAQTVTSDLTLYAKWEEGDDTPDIWDGTSKEPSYNADTKTYTITNGEELAWVSDVVDGRIQTGDNFPLDTSFAGYTIELANDIYLNDISNIENWDTSRPTNSWDGIGNYNNKKLPFAGTFDGKNYYIKGMYANVSYNLGLFTYSSGIIKNIVLSDSFIDPDPNGYKAGIVAYNGGTVERCINFASLIANAGIIGDMVEDDVTVSYCINHGNITDDGRNYTGLGGIIGSCLAEITIANCVNTGKLTSINSSNGYVGGIVGCGSWANLIEYCYNTGKISVSNIASPYTYIRVCGIGGADEIRCCYNTGYLSVENIESDNYPHISGIGSAVELNNCYNMGDTKCYADGVVGGITSSMADSTEVKYLQYCYSTGTAVSYYLKGTIVGALAGSKYQYVNSKNYYVKYCYSTKTPLYNLTGDGDYYRNISNVSSITSSKLKSLSNLSGFSTSNWATNSNINDGYPYLKGLEETYKTYTITTIVDEDNSSLNRSFANISGTVFGSGSQVTNVGGAIGLTDGDSAKDFSVAQNFITIADGINANATGNYKAYAGSVVGDNSKNYFAFNNAYYNSEMSVESSTNSINTTGTAKSKKTINVAFLTNILGLTQYTSLDNIKTDSSAVWVLKNGELPELYYNCLNDITVSDDIENGTVTVDRAQAVDGEVVNVSAVPAENYVLNKIYVNGNEVTGTTFEVSGDANVYATFSPQTEQFDVSIAQTENATGTLANADATDLMSGESTSLTAYDGEEIRVSATADSDYTIDAIYVNGEEIAGDSFILTADTEVTMDVTSTSTEVKATTNDAEDVGAYFATLGGSVDSESDGAIRYIRYWVTDEPETVYTTEVQSGKGEYSVEVQGLESNTGYSFQMTENGDVKTFTTLSDAESSDEFGEEEGTEFVYAEHSISGKYYVFDVTYFEALNSGCVMVVLYDNNNAMIDFTYVDADGKEEYQLIIPKVTNTKYAKVYIWDSIETLNPICKSYTVSIN